MRKTMNPKEKSGTRVLPVVFALFVFGAPRASGGGADSPRESLWKDPSLGRLSVGTAWEKERRELAGPGFEGSFLETRGWYLHAGLDVLPWLAVYGGGGQHEAKSAPLLGYGDYEGRWMGGVRADVWERHVESPDFLDSIWRIQAAYHYADNSASFETAEMDWAESRASVTLRTEFIVRPAAAGDKVVPYSAVLSAGPVLSQIDGTRRDIEGGERRPGVDFEEDSDLGLLLGLDVRLAQNVSVDWQARLFEDDTHTVGVVYHF